MWLNSNDHQWDDEMKVVEANALLVKIVPTWFVQQNNNIKLTWPLIQETLIENFAHQDITQTALQQFQYLQ
jgi:hypothetical protein